MLYPVVFLFFHVSSFPLIVIVLFQGTHDHLMAKQRYYHGLVGKQEGRDSDPSSAPILNGPSRSTSSTNLKKMDTVALQMGEQDIGRRQEYYRWHDQAIL